MIHGNIFRQVIVLLLALHISAIFCKENSKQVLTTTAVDQTDGVSNKPNAKPQTAHSTDSSPHTATSQPLQKNERKKKRQIAMGRTKPEATIFKMWRKFADFLEAENEAEVRDRLYANLQQTQKGQQQQQIAPPVKKVLVPFPIIVTHNGAGKSSIIIKKSVNSEDAEAAERLTNIIKNTQSETFGRNNRPRNKFHFQPLITTEDPFNEKYREIERMREELLAKEIEARFHELEVDNNNDNKKPTSNRYNNELDYEFEAGENIPVLPAKSINARPAISNYHKQLVADHRGSETGDTILIKASQLPRNARFTDSGLPEFFLDGAGAEVVPKPSVEDDKNKSKLTRNLQKRFNGEGTVTSRPELPQVDFICSVAEVLHRFTCKPADPDEPSVTEMKDVGAVPPTGILGKILENI